MTKATQPGPEEHRVDILVQVIRDDDRVCIAILRNGHQTELLRVDTDFAIALAEEIRDAALDSTSAEESE